MSTGLRKRGLSSLLKDRKAYRNRQYWSGRHVAITGGSSGIGLATTNLALDLGARVTVLALPDDHLEQLAASTAATSGRLVADPADVTRPDQVAGVLDRGRERHGPVGALITCAGIVRPDYFGSLSEEDFSRHMEVNFFGTLHAVREVLPDLQTAGSGSITCVSSAAGFLGVFGYGAYSPSKFAVKGLCEVLRQELRPQGVSVTVVCPQDVDTPMLEKELRGKPAELRALSGEKTITPQRVAREILTGTVAGRAEVLPGLSTKAVRLISGAAPGITARIMDRIIAKTQAR